MYSRIFSVAIALAAAAAAQPTSQRAAIVGGGNPNAGQCTVTVTVDGQADIEIRGANATMRNLGGAPPQWRRFECTSAIPPNPNNFQFAGLNGRGQQNLVTEPRNGGPAVVRIEDSEGGASEYTFRVMWSNYAPGQDRGPAARDDRGFQGDRDHPGDRDRPGDRRPDRDAYYGDRDAFFRGNNGRAMLFERVRQDLDHATSGAFPFTGDRARLVRTQTELNELQQKLARGFYDERELDEVTTALQAVVEGNRLAPRDRAMLTDDLNRMRDFKARHDDYGAHFGPGADRDGDRRSGRENRGDNSRAMLFQRTREDLDRATSGLNFDRRESQRLDRAQYQLNDLQAKMSQRIYDERELNEVIGSLQVFVESSQVAPRDRNILAEDRKRLVEFSVHHDGYSAR